MPTFPLSKPIDDEGTPLAYSGVMPIAQKIPSRAGSDDDALPATDAARRALDIAEAKREAEARADARREALDADNLYDNVACTD